MIGYFSNGQNLTSLCFKMGDPCLVNLAKATNDELDDIKFALEETKATLEEQNTLKMRLEEANQEIHKLKNSTDEGMIIEEIRKQLKDAKVSCQQYLSTIFVNNNCQQ